MGKDTFFSSFALRAGKKLIAYSRPCVLGILNSTPDSFYDGGSYLTDEAVALRAEAIAAQGADIIDVGVVSSRPGARLLPPDEEAKRLSRVVGVVRRVLPDAVISADTCYSLPAAAAVAAGADIINDISGGQFDPDMFRTVADLHVPYVFSHTRGLPSEMDGRTDYDDLVGELIRYFSRGLDELYRLGVADVILDPGFGFAKTVDQCLFLLDNLDQLTRFFREPLLAGVSRKRMVCQPLGITPDEALQSSLVAARKAIEKGAKLVRVHDVAETAEMIRSM